MPPGLRRSIVNALERGAIEIANAMDGTFEDADILIMWRGKVYRLSADRST